jgi:hypothetical protein
MDKQIKFNQIKLLDIYLLCNYKLYEIKINKGILINSFAIKSNKFFKFNISINNNHFLQNIKSTFEYELESDYNPIDGYYYNFKFDSDIFIEYIRLIVYNQNSNLYLEYDDTNLFNSYDDILNKYLDQYVFTKKYFKFFTNDIFDVELDEIILNKDKIDKNLYKFKYLNIITYYINEYLKIKNLIHKLRNLRKVTNNLFKRKV